MSRNKLNVLFACCGVGHIQRGYETHMIDLYSQLKNSDIINITLLKGGGTSLEFERRIFCIQRNSWFARLIQSITGKPAYMIEQISFFFMSIFYIIFNKPDTIYCPDFTLLRLYVILKRMTGLKYKTLLCNGGNYKEPFFGIDHIQFILPNYETDIKFAKKSVIPHGFDLYKFKSLKTKDQLRFDLNLPLNKTIILSVGAINCSVKRMDYIINEVASLEDKKLFLLLIGQKDEQSYDVEELGLSKLRQNFEIRTIDYDNIQDYYFSSDVFCLGSLDETFGKTLVEAALCKLPVLAHDFEISRTVLGKFGYYGDFRQEGILKKMLEDILENGPNYDLNIGVENAGMRFGWEGIIKDYEKMFVS